MKSEKFIIIKDYRNAKSYTTNIGLQLITSTKFKKDASKEIEIEEKFAIYNKKLVDAIGFANGCKGERILIEIYETSTI